MTVFTLTYTVSENVQPASNPRPTPSESCRRVRRQGAVSAGAHRQEAAPRSAGFRQHPSQLLSRHRRACPRQIVQRHRSPSEKEDLFSFTQMLPPTRPHKTTPRFHQQPQNPAADRQDQGSQAPRAPRGLWAPTRLLTSSPSGESESGPGLHGFPGFSCLTS